MPVPRAKASTDKRPELLTINEAAELLRVHHRTIRKYIAEGRLPGYHLGDKAVRLRRNDVEALLTPIPAGFKW